MSFCIVISSINVRLAAALYTDYFDYKAADIISEVIECVENYNRMIPFCKKDTLMALRMLNVVQNMESLGYEYIDLTSCFDSTTKNIVKKEYGKFFYVLDKTSEVKVVSIIDENIKKMAEKASFVVNIDIFYNKVTLNMFNYTSNKERFRSIMELDKDYDLSYIKMAPVESIYDICMYDLEDIKEFVSENEDIGFTDGKVYYFPGKVKYLYI